MAHLDQINRTTPEAAPEYGRIPDACRHFGVSRTRIYHLAAAGVIRLIKDGDTTTTLADFGSIRRYLASCRTADIRLPSCAGKLAGASP